MRISLFNERSGRSRSRIGTRAVQRPRCARDAHGARENRTLLGSPRRSPSADTSGWRSLRCTRKGVNRKASPLLPACDSIPRGMRKRGDGLRSGNDNAIVGRLTAKRRGFFFSSSSFPELARNARMRAPLAFSSSRDAAA